MLVSMKKQTDPDVLLLAAAADPTRLGILRQLSAGPPVCACDFSACCDVAQPTVSHHLRCLREAGWVTTERRGTWILYSLSPAAVERFRAIGLEIRSSQAATAEPAAEGCHPGECGCLTEGAGPPAGQFPAAD
jgi:DNA-binding transcriptional ArsR family regulator